MIVKLCQYSSFLCQENDQKQNNPSQLHRPLDLLHICSLVGWCQTNTSATAISGKNVQTSVSVEQNSLPGSEQFFSVSLPGADAISRLPQCGTSGWLSTIIPWPANNNSSSYSCQSLHTNIPSRLQRTTWSMLTRLQVCNSILRSIQLQLKQTRLQTVRNACRTDASLTDKASRQ